LYCALALTGVVPYGDTPPGEIVMGDGAAYYYVATPYDWSDRPAGVAEYRYSPAFLALTAPLRLLPWELFAFVWVAGHIGVLLYLRVPWMLAFPGVIDDVVRGNINTFLVLAVVLVIRHGASALWATVLLTKVTPGVGMLWHAARREWGHFWLAATVTIAIVAIGSLLNPQMWADWVRSLLIGADDYRTVDVVAPLAMRIVGGAAIAVVAGMSNRPWLLPIGMLVAVPGFWPSSFALLVASVVLYKDMAAHRLVPVPMASESRFAPIQAPETAHAPEQGEALTRS
jgi:hypothetical protein